MLILSSVNSYKIYILSSVNKLIPSSEAYFLWVFGYLVVIDANLYSIHINGVSVSKYQNIDHKSPVHLLLISGEKKGSLVLKRDK
jgi:hypothetical protein